MVSAVPSVSKPPLPSAVIPLSENVSVTASASCAAMSASVTVLPALSLLTTLSAVILVSAADAPPLVLPQAASESSMAPAHRIDMSFFMGCDLLLLLCPHHTEDA